MTAGSAALFVGVAATLVGGCARTPLPFSEAEDASEFGPIAPYDAGAGLDPGGGFGAGGGDAPPDTPPVRPEALAAACGRDFETSLFFTVADAGPPGEARSDEFTGFLAEVEPGRFSVKLSDRVETFGLWRPSGAAIPFGIGERITVAYRLDPAALTAEGGPSWSLTLSGDEGPRYAARSGRAETTDALLGLWLRGERADCPEHYIGDCIQAQEAVAVLEHPNGGAVALGSGGRARVDTPEAGPVAVVVHAALDDSNACAAPETWGLFVALEMER